MRTVYLIATLVTLLSCYNVVEAFLRPCAHYSSLTANLHNGHQFSLMTRNKMKFGRADFDTMERKLHSNESTSSDIAIGIISARWNNEIVNKLRVGARETLSKMNILEKNIYDLDVPGAYELPYATRLLSMSNKVDAIIPIGCLIKGETYHFEYISEAVAHGLMKVQLETTVPVIYGVLSCMNMQQAIARSSGENNHGVSWAMTALEMALMRRDALRKASILKRKAIGFVESTEDKNQATNSIAEESYLANISSIDSGSNVFF